MKILAINGSHRKGRNTARMLEAVLEEARSLGAETELLELSDYNIKPCRACNHCLRAIECSIQDDDIKLITDKMLIADAIVLGSPVYFFNVTGLMKNFMDRTRWLHMCRNVLYGKVGAAVTHAGLRNGGQEFTQMILERYLASHGMIVVDSRDQESGIYNYGPTGTLFERLEGSRVIWKKGVEEDLLALHECRTLGKNIVRQVQLLEASSIRRGPVVANTPSSPFSC
ncbi:Multimeric flavodoxin WrbA [Thermanaeromonas toyohensis ToBE]|uniref:Multimeric flavodoxin WrbA n=1 Tax=Thermanaeromonas toyohensis ToBE TaxID=698762 RepID=A0A1W1VG34_9FIRM|nr:flavodoxin family protein [Thermanaeromonas toyohensis]SMB92286.1 Multimeric flavodoxin WrbA [Thermanaeromonas toyohensis ToBE]